MRRGINLFARVVRASSLIDIINQSSTKHDAWVYALGNLWKEHSRRGSQENKDLQKFPTSYGMNKYIKLLPERRRTTFIM